MRPRRRAPGGDPPPPPGRVRPALSLLVNLVLLPRQASCVGTAILYCASQASSSQNDSSPAACRCVQCLADRGLCDTATLGPARLLHTTERKETAIATERRPPGNAPPMRWLRTKPVVPIGRLFLGPDLAQGCTGPSKAMLAWPGSLAGHVLIA